MLSPEPNEVSTSAQGGTSVAKGETSKLIVLAMALGLIVLVVLGVHPPAPLDNLLHGAAAELGVSR